MDFKVLRNKVGHNLRQASPYILFGTGIITFGCSIAAAIKATRKLDPILEEHHKLREDIAKIREEALKDVEGLDEATENIEKEGKKAVRKLYLQTGGKIARLYAPTAIITAVSTASFGASFGIIRGRYIMALGAFQSITETFGKYRDNVIEDAGYEKDMEYLYGLKKEKVTSEEIDPETGKKKKVKEEVLTGKPDGPFVYGFEQYDYQTGKGSTQWDPSNAYNQAYILGILRGFQANLNTGARVYLHSVLDQLGFNEYEDKWKTDTQIQAERMAGWMPGDVIECGIEEGGPGHMVYENRAFVNGDSPDCTLIFNCRPNVFSIKE